MKRSESRTRYFIRTTSNKRGWNTNHVSKGGDFLEEQEIINFPSIGLGQERPDFLICFKGEPIIVIEAKNDIKKIDQSIEEAVKYADKKKPPNSLQTKDY